MGKKNVTINTTQKKRSTPDFPQTANRFVAYFDILGFKSFVRSHSHEAVEERMNIVVNAIKVIDDKRIKNKQGLVALFSDSILLVSRGDTPKDAEEVLSRSAYFLHKMIQERIPIKGAIAHGKFTADFRRSKLFGQSLVDAYTLSEEVHCYSVVLHSSFDAKLTKASDSYVGREKVPMKTGHITHYYVKYDSWLETEIKQPLVEELFAPFYFDTSGNTRKYIDNTIELYSHDADKKKQACDLKKIAPNKDQDGENIISDEKKE